MLTLNFEKFPELETDRCFLRNIRLEDAPMLFELRKDPRVMHFIGKEPMTTVKEAEQLIEQFISTYSAGEGITWVVTIKGNDSLIGTAGLWRIIRDHYRAEIGYTLSPDFWQKGIMAEVNKRIIDFGFEQMNLHSIEGNCDPENQASVRLMEKLGFVREGYFRENFYFRGKFLDTAAYSLVRNEE